MRYIVVLGGAASGGDAGISITNLLRPYEDLTWTLAIDKQGAVCFIEG